MVHENLEDRCDRSAGAYLICCGQCCADQSGVGGNVRQRVYREFDAGNFPQALKQLDAIDARQPDLAASKNLRGVILMRQGNYDQAEAALTEAARIDPKFWNARFNLAEIPFLKKDWAEARNRFEQLLSSGQSDLAKEASQLIQYKIF